MVSSRIKRFTSRLVVGCMMLSSFGIGNITNAAGSAESSHFTDIQDSYANKEIKALVDAGIVSGFSDGIFKPQEAMTRAQLAKVIVLSLGLSENANAVEFTDVPKDAWYRGYVGALIQSGITQGTGPNQFSPDQKVTREELAVFFIRGFGLEEKAKEASSNVQLSDMDQVSSWAKGSVALAFQIGFINGTDDPNGALRFAPKESAERQALARLGYEFKVNKNQYIEKAKQVGSSNKAETSLEVSSIVSTSETTMEVVFASPVGTVNPADFTFDSGLKIEKAVLKEGSTTTVILTTSKQEPGKVYKLSYKGKETSKTAAGSAPAIGGGGGGSSSSSSSSNYQYNNLSVTGVTYQYVPTVLVSKKSRTQEDVNSAVYLQLAANPGIQPIQITAQGLNGSPSYYLAPVQSSADIQLWYKNPQGNWLDLKDGATPLPSAGNASVTLNVYALSNQGGMYAFNLNLLPSPTGSSISTLYTQLNFKTPTAPVAVQLLSFNDLHGKIDQTYALKNFDADGVLKLTGNFGRMDYVAAYLKQRELSNPNSILVHAGDAVGGSSPVSALNKEEPTVDILNTLGFSVGTVGNHEFDKGVTEMLRLIKGEAPNATPDYLGMGFPLVAANVVYKDNGQLVLPPYAVQKVGGVKIGFIGVVTKSALGMVMPKGVESIQVTDEAAAVNQYVQELKAQGVRSIVVLAHMDAAQEKPGAPVTGPAAEMATKLDPEVDVILAAHNHKVVNGTVNNILIMQAFEYGKAIGDVDLLIDPATGDVVQKKAEIVYIDQAKMTPDAQVTATIKKYTDLIASKLNEVEGTAAIDMLGGYTNNSDNALGNLIADSMRVEMQADFAMVNGGGIRTNLNAGSITWEQLFNILPFNNILQKVEFKGSDLEPIINAQLSSLYGGDFSISGFKYTWDSSDYKVKSITLADGSPIDPNKTYTMVLNDFMYTATAFKYKEMGTRGKNPITGPEDLQALVNYVKSFKTPIAYYADQRIVLTTSNMKVTGSTITINALTKGNVVKVYDSETSTAPLATTVAAGTSVTVNGAGFPTGLDKVYVTITKDSNSTSSEGFRIPLKLK